MPIPESGNEINAEFVKRVWSRILGASKQSKIVWLNHKEWFVCRSVAKPPKPSKLLVLPVSQKAKLVQNDKLRRVGVVAPMRRDVLSVFAAHLDECVDE